MKAVAVYPALKKIGFIEEPTPEITHPVDIKVKILQTGICGTDREISNFQYGTPPEGCGHLIIGHESLGQVVEKGTLVEDFHEADLVVIMVRRPCHEAKCIACRNKRQDFCYSGNYMERGIKGMHGFMAEFTIDKSDYMVKVPDELYDVAVLTEPLSVAEKAFEQVTQVQQRLPWGLPGEKESYRHKAVILGAGPVGLLGAMLLKIKGFNVFVYSRQAIDSPQAKIVTAIGAKFIPSNEINIEDFVNSTGNIDLVYEATGAAKISFDLLEHLGTNGVFVTTGVPGRREQFEIDGANIMKSMVLNNQVFFGTVNAPKKAYVDAVRDLGIFMKHWPDALKSIITNRDSINNVPKLLSEKRLGIKTVIDISGESE